MSGATGHTAAEADHRPVSICEAGPSDRAAVVRLWLMGMEHHQRVAPDEFLLSKTATHRYGERFKTRMKNDAVQYILAVAPAAVGTRSGANEAECAVVGYLCGSIRDRPPVFSPARWGIIHELVVDPAHRRRGFARALHDSFVDWAQRRDAERIAVNVYIENGPGRAFWVAMGYGPRTQRYVLPLEARREDGDGKEGRDGVEDGAKG